LDSAWGGPHASPSSSAFGALGERRLQLSISGLRLKVRSPLLCRIRPRRIWIARVRMLNARSDAEFHLEFAMQDQVLFPPLFARAALLELPVCAVPIALGALALAIKLLHQRERIERGV
jgi:hypothetical protein